MFEIKDKIALVTGAASGIGLAYVKELLLNGCKGVALLDINEELGNSITDELKQEFGKDSVIFLKVDVSDPLQLGDAFEKTVNFFKQLDIVINNAGTNDETNFQKTIGVNFSASVHGTKFALEKYLPQYKLGEEGIVVNTSSTAALLYRPDFPVYSSTKLAMIMFSKCLSMRNENKNFRILTLCPGATLTPLYVAAVDLLIDVEETKKYADICNPQSTETLGKALTKVINAGKSGSVWIVEGGKPAREITVECAMQFD